LIFPPSWTAYVPSRRDSVKYGGTWKEYQHSPLLGAGADVNVIDKDGKTSMMYASDNGCTEIAQLLRQAGAKE
jgi:hypothetical protein